MLKTIQSLLLWEIQYFERNSRLLRKKTGNHREALKLLVLKTLFTSWQIKETLFIHLCNEYVLCLERFDEREQSITRNAIWIVIQKKKK